MIPVPNLRHKCLPAARDAACGLVLACFLGWSPPALAQELEAKAPRDHSAKEFTRQVQDAIKRIRLSPVDSAYILERLEVTASKIPDRFCRWEESLAAQPSLRQLSWSQGQLARLRENLRARYQIAPSRRRATNALNQEGAPLPPMEEVLARLWRLSISEIYFGMPETRPSRRQPGLARWTRPLRIAATGDSIIDRSIATAVAELRRRHPSVPIDGSTFPSSLPTANAFFRIKDIQCPERQPCRRIQTDKLLSEEPTRWSRSLYNRRPLIFFNQLKRGKWIEGAEIFPISASPVGSAVDIVAWRRVDQSGSVGTAACNLPPRTSFSGATPDEARAAHDTAVSQCLAAMLGAPAGLPIRGLNYWSADKYLNGCATRGSGYQPDQEEVLRQLYRAAIDRVLGDERG